MLKVKGGRSARLALYCSLRREGKSRLLATADLGISSGTARAYEQAWVRNVESNTLSLSSPSLTKDQLSAKLSSTIADPTTPVQYLASLATALSRLMGFDAPKQVEVAQVALTPLSSLLETWAREDEAVPLPEGGAPILGQPGAACEGVSLRGPGEPPKSHESISSSANSPLATQNGKILPASPEDATSYEGVTQIVTPPTIPPGNPHGESGLQIGGGETKPDIILLLNDDPPLPRVSVMGLDNPPKKEL